MFHLNTNTAFRSLLLATVISGLTLITCYQLLLLPYFGKIPAPFDRYLSTFLCVLIFIVFWVLFLYSLIQWAAVKFLDPYLINQSLLRLDHANYQSIPFVYRLLMYLSGRDLQLGHFSELYRIRSAPSSIGFEQLLSLRYQHFQESINPLEFGISVLPMLGFIGTVYGISGAIQELGNSFLKAGGKINMADKAMESVFVNLSVAFDTTLIALCLVIPLMILALMIKRHWQRLDLAYELIFLTQCNSCEQNEPSPR